MGIDRFDKGGSGCRRTGNKVKTGYLKLTGRRGGIEVKIQPKRAHKQKTTTDGRLIRAARGRLEEKKATAAQMKGQH